MRRDFAEIVIFEQTFITWGLNAEEIVVPRPRVELGTPAFSGRCSTA